MAFDRRETAILLVGDFLVLVASLWAALFLRNLALPSWGYFEHNLIPFIPVFLLSIAVFYIAGLYEKQTRPIRRVMGVRILGSQGATVAIAAILFFVLPLSIAPKTILVLYLIVSVVAESVWRFYRIKREISAGRRAPALLIGHGRAVVEMHDEVNNNDRYLIRFASWFSSEHAKPGEVKKAIIDAIRNGVAVIVLDRADAAVRSAMPELYALMADHIVFLEFSDLYEEIFDRVPLEHLDPSELLESLPRARIYDLAKRLFDLVLALALSVVAVPFVMVAAILLAPSGAPFIRAERVGKGGRRFRLWKLRSMLMDDRGDPELRKLNRVTALGKVLRKTRIDELPQLINVIAGELSFIGPRPELPNLVDVYENELPHYHMRHLIAPGLSGWAQIHDYDAPRGPADVVRTRRKLSFDLYYLKHRSFGLDMAVALKTVRALVAFSGT